MQRSRNILFTVSNPTDIDVKKSLKEQGILGTMIWNCWKHCNKKTKRYIMYMSKGAYNNRKLLIVLNVGQVTMILQNVILTMIKSNYMNMKFIKMSSILL